ncbi:hypothetical protein [Neisseria shayeganii]|uniref:hypothetical protein n=1 Tax=Neisseria shayeganii TaxID=607712 RepID=UPI0012EA74CF|nr:hypothetical protein [Neisseria shayeganii]
MNESKIKFDIILIVFVVCISAIAIYLQMPSSEEDILQERNKAIAIEEVYKIADKINGKVVRVGYKSSEGSSIYYSAVYDLNNCITYSEWRNFVKQLGYSVSTVVMENTEFNKKGVYGSIPGGYKEKYCDELYIKFLVNYY